MNALGATWKNNGKGVTDYFAAGQATDGAAAPSSDTLANRVWATSYAIPGVLGKPWSAIMQGVSKPVVAVSGGGGIIPDVIPPPIVPPLPDPTVKKPVVPDPNLETTSKTEPVKIFQPNTTPTTPKNNPKKKLLPKSNTLAGKTTPASSVLGASAIESGNTGSLSTVQAKIASVVRNTKHGLSTAWHWFVNLFRFRS